MSQIFTTPDGTSCFTAFEKIYNVLSKAKDLEPEAQDIYLLKNLSEREIITLTHFHMKYVSYDLSEKEMLHKLYIGHHVQYLLQPKRLNPQE